VTFAKFCLTIIYMILLTICCRRVLTPHQRKTRVERAPVKVRLRYCINDWLLTVTLHLSTYYIRVSQHLLCIECATERLTQTVSFITRLWTCPVVLENRLCHHCSCVHQEELVHALCACPLTLSGKRYLNM